MTSTTNLINKHTNKSITFLSLLAVVAFTVVALFLTSCERDQQPEQRKAVTINVKTEGLHIQNLKSFELNTWQYNYNPNQYELKFTGSKGTTYSFQKSISELSQGFQVSIMPDTYTITYISTHTPTSQLSQTLDITINQTKSITTSQDLSLQALNDDMLLILDVEPIAAYINSPSYGDMQLFTMPNQTYLWAYYDVEGDVKISYRNGQGSFDKTITNAKKGNVYHIVSTTNGNTNINIKPFEEILLGW